MINKIAIGVDNILFKQNRILDENWAKKFPGLSWIPIFCEIVSKDFQVVTADIALSHVKNGFWDPNTILVIQHQVDEECNALIEYGSIPLILTAMESPIYSIPFLRYGKKIGKEFYYRIMLNGLYEYFSFESGTNYPLRFPSYHKNEIEKLKSWEDKKFMVAFMKNMYSNYFSTLYLKHPYDFFKLLFRVLNKIKKIDFSFNVLRKFKHKQLHDKRIESLIYFLKEGKVELFGAGWDNLNNLPNCYRLELSKLFSVNKPFFYENKIKKISDYKFCLCFENASYKGGVSEKIIDCFIAGVIPVYLGASDIEFFFPSDSFVDVREFKRWNLLLDYLMNLSNEKAEIMINSGRCFLNSDEGEKHSYEGFAEFIKSLIYNTSIVI